VSGVALDRIAFAIGGKMPGAQCDRLINSHIIPDNRRFADHHTGAVINEKARSDGRPRMDVDAGLGVSDLGDQAREQPRTQSMENMCKAMMNDRRHPRVTDQDFGKIPRRGIADECRPQIADEKSPHPGQLRGKGACQFDRLLAAKSRQQFIAHEQRAAMDLFAQGIKRDAQRVAYKIIDVLAIKVELPVMARKQRLRQAVEDVLQRITGRGTARFAVSPDTMGFFP
jgi:hypothetical protein